MTHSVIASSGLLARADHYDFNFLPEHHGYYTFDGSLTR